MQTLCFETTGLRHIFDLDVIKRQEQLVGVKIQVADNIAGMVRKERGNSALKTREYIAIGG